METERLTVELGDRSYPVSVGAGLLEGIADALDGPAYRKVLVISDRNVGPLYADRVLSGFTGKGSQASLVEIDPGESSKSLENAAGLLESLASEKLSREDLVLALGGGVVGDISGFVASIYKRGVPLVQVPTTLMSQVDSSIGGKTGVDLGAGKNLVGTFYQPRAVFCDVGTLGTLNSREYRSGLAEVAKYCFLAPGTMEGVITSPSVLAGYPAAGKLASIVARCAAVKAETVASDEFDRIGVRAALNYGHTLGHALETQTGYRGDYTHGEAVSVGMVFAAIVSSEVGIAGGELVEEQRRFLTAIDLPARPHEPAPDFARLREIMLMDKKGAGDITMVLMEGPGRPVLRKGLPPEMLERCYRRLLEGR